MLSAVGVRAAGKQLSWHKRTQSAGWCPGRLCRAWLQECCHLLPANLSTHQETFISVTPNFTLGFLSVATRARSLPRSLAIPFHQDGAHVGLLSPSQSNMALVLGQGWGLKRKRKCSLWAVKWSGTRSYQDSSLLSLSLTSKLRTSSGLNRCCYQKPQTRLQTFHYFHQQQLVQGILLHYGMKMIKEFKTFMFIYTSAYYLW